MTRRIRTLRVPSLSRVEGEGGVVIRLRGQEVVDVKLAIFEPPRLFEALLRGRALVEAPDITSRICGICPVAYLMTSCQAMEQGLGLRVDPSVRALRQLMYCGEWIESHGLHVFMLHAPDFLGFPDALAMARKHRIWVERGLSIKKTGNQIVKLLGGRAIHPVNVRVGGFYRAPVPNELSSLLPELEASREAAADALAWMARFDFPKLERDYELVALRHDAEYAVLDGRVCSSKGLSIDVADYDSTSQVNQVPYSAALHGLLGGGRPYLCGPLARFNLSFELLSPELQRLAHAAGIEPPCLNPFRTILVRLVEIIHALGEAARIVERYVPPPAAPVELAPRAATGCAATEAPRGLLFHRYAVSERGVIEDARILPPTVPNQTVIEEDIRSLGAMLARLPARRAKALAECAVRNHDPCISCATHAVRVKVERGPGHRRPG